MRSGERGFTMMELMVTLVISVFGLLGVLGMHATLSQNNALPQDLCGSN